ncbi:enoyl-[acyl-carrier protein] reductase II [Anaerobranca californiensis DSM 14826]|uniref:Probable nitronate monooxygenase n=1 Tax=Anaerobranca californiensis DSM 14826 TaxID=1120989 RepID=A0A1M6MH08_9FIRM|nr:enoyl-[acyl-carrier-protein] reductase FabK [Anaerobranca californiensis]SHJ82769.1 enoyl-[acyl-carrier protein] reductase II [Anaerobranca californiensis DSM 14826]
MIKTKLCDMLGIKYPIIQGGMAWLATYELAAAVSEAGGLGIIGAGNAPPSWVEDQIDKLRERTDKPFGVNVMLLSPYASQVIDVVIKKRVPVVTTGAGNPGPYVEKLKEAGCKIIPVVPSVALAKRMERIGVDGIIGEGMEAGGHIGDLTTMVMIPQLVDAVKIPVIAAGGIGDGRGFAAALALGAQGIQVGTRFVCAQECIAHPAYKEMFIKAKDRDTVVTGRSTGHPVRSLKNKFVKEFELKEKGGADPQELEKLGIGRYRLAAIEGDVVQGSVLAGQVAAMITKVEPAKDIIDELVADCYSTIKFMGRLYGE